MYKTIEALDSVQCKLIDLHDCKIINTHKNILLKSNLSLKINKILIKILKKIKTHDIFAVI